MTGPLQTAPLTLPESEQHMSSVLKNLLKRLLRKDPMRRITWEELLTHPFWGDSIPMPQPKALAPIPIYDTYIQEREYIPTCPQVKRT